MKLRLLKILRVIQWIGAACVKIGVSAGCGYLVYLRLAPLAYAERGYMAYGGECLVGIAAAAFISIFLFSPYTKTDKEYEIKMEAKPSARKVKRVEAFYVKR